MGVTCHTRGGEAGDGRSDGHAHRHLPPVGGVGGVGQQLPQRVTGMQLKGPADPQTNLVLSHSELEK